ncbi:Histone deacetylation protein Rxt3 [Ceratocystis platani]|uniref:Histone deacetylation protein Rxt3 n=2 Tax=Ceratocystis TaxID=5157 RepID=A0A0F8BRD5_CERFI|nr:Histone deacetylation protein Rxt3 [Ceratocystis platani]
MTVTSQLVLDSVAHKPRHFLGDVVYDPIITAERLVPIHPSNRGYKTTPRPLPLHLIKDKENCTLTVKVPKVHLHPTAREEITARRAIWGTDVYTDDSDIIAACIHAGWIRGEWPEDVDTDLLDLHRGIGYDEKLGSSNANTSSNKPADKDAFENDRQASHAAMHLTAPPATGPVPVRPGCDLQVTLLVLPKLRRYASSTRFGIQSREFGRNHDGLSFMITGVRWVVNGAAPQSRLRGKARRERMRQALAAVRFPQPSGQGQIQSAGVESAKQAVAASVARQAPGESMEGVQRTGNLTAITA